MRQAINCWQDQKHECEMQKTNKAHKGEELVEEEEDIADSPARVKVIVHG